MKTGFGLLLVCAFLTVGCQKSDFLYYQKNLRPGENLRFEHKLKELQGESKVDVLWTIDNSGSMDRYQQAVANNIGSFMNEFVKVGLEWRMALISTDPGISFVKPYLGMAPNDIFDHRDPNPQQRFKNAVARLGTNGSSIECSFIPIQFHLNKYPNFLRSNAVLALMMVTDAPEQSETKSGIFGSPIPYNLSTNDFLAYLKKVKGTLDRVVAYGAFAAPDINCPTEDEQWNYHGSRYEQVINTTKGKYFSLCEKDFGKHLANFGKDLAKRVTTPSIFLTRRPKPETIKIYFHNQLLPGGLKETGGYWLYSFDRNSILFHDLAFAISDNESVTVEFEEMAQ